MMARTGLLAALLVVVLPVPAGMASVSPFVVPAPVEAELDNGLRVVVFQDDRRPVVRMALLVPAGVAVEPASSPGVATFTAQMLSQGTVSHDAEAFSTALAAIGASFSAGVYSDFTIVESGCLADHAPAALDLLAEAVTHPAFPSKRVGRVRWETTRALLNRRTIPALTADEEVWPFVLEGHLYGRPPNGSVGSLLQMTPAEIVPFHQTHYRPAGSVLAIAGDIEPERAFAAARTAFGAWQGAPPPTASMPLSPTSMRGRVRIVDVPDARVSEVRLVLPGPGHGSADYTAMVILDRILGGGPGSRLSRTRHIPGVLGQPRSRYTALRDAGLWWLGAAVRTDSVGTATGALMEYVSEGSTKQPMEAELNTARRVARNVHPFRFETLDGLLSTWLFADHYGVAEEALRGYRAAMDILTPEILGGVLHRWIVPARIHVLAVGPADRLRGQLARFGDVEITRPQEEVEQAGRLLAGPAEEDMRQGRETVARAVAAHGGIEKLRGLTSSTMEARIVVLEEGREVEGRMRQVRRDPMQYRESVEIGVLRNETIMNGDHGWIFQGSEERFEQADSLQLATMRVNLTTDLPHLLLQAAAEGAVPVHRGQATVRGRKGELIEVRIGDGEARWLVVDAESDRLLAMQVRAGVPPQVVARREFSDFREIGGLWLPFVEERFLADERIMRIEAQQIAVNVNLPPDTFYPSGFGN